MLMQIVLVNQTKGHIFYEGEYEEPPTENPGRLFHLMRREYGRCTSKVYVDTRDREAIPVGWHFEKIEHYTDTKQPYRQGAWVTLHTWPEGAPRACYLTLDGEEIRTWL
jgi:hypothetical protein